jgi:hypothetical protein
MTSEDKQLIVTFFKLKHFTLPKLEAKIKLSEMNVFESFILEGVEYDVTVVNGKIEGYRTSNV